MPPQKNATRRKSFETSGATMIEGEGRVNHISFLLPRDEFHMPLQTPHNLPRDYRPVMGPRQPNHLGRGELQSRVGV